MDYYSYHDFSRPIMAADLSYRRNGRYSSKLIYFKSRRKRRWDVLGVFVLAYVGFLCVAVVHKLTDSGDVIDGGEPGRYKRDVRSENGKLPLK